MQSLLDFGARYIYRNYCDDIEHQRICSKHVDVSMKKYITKMALMLLGYFAAIFGPIYSIILGEKLVTTIEIKVPFASEKSTTDIVANQLIQLAYATVGGSFYIGIEVMMEIFSSIITISPKLVENKLEKFIGDFAAKRITVHMSQNNPSTLTSMKRIVLMFLLRF